MAHTNSTTYMHLPLFVGTDKPAWLTDFNSAMQAIDNTSSQHKDDIDALQLAVTALQNSIANLHPVGSIYISVASTNPANLFGGVWQRIQDTFLLAAGVGYPAGSTGGEPSHILTVDELPEHRHHIGYGANVYASSFGALTPNASQAGSSSSNATDAVGSGSPHNNMPPYLAVYVWQRTA